DGHERMIARYAHMKQLETMLDHGLGVFNDETNAFEKIAELDMSEKWRCPHGHPLRAKTDDGDHLYFSDGYDSLAPLPAVRGLPRFDAVTRGAEYEAFTPLEVGTRFAGDKTRLAR